MKDTQVLSSAAALQEAQSKIPSYPRTLEYERDQQALPTSNGNNNNMMDMVKQKIKQDVTTKIDKLLRAIEDKLDSQPDNNIVEESVQRSMFGIFARNFKMFKEQQQTSDLDGILRRYFKQSQILDDVQSKNKHK